MPKNTHDVIVVGAGHNGLTAASYMAKAGLDVVVLEKNNELIMTYGTTIIGKESTDMRILGKTNQNKGSGH